MYGFTKPPQLLKVSSTPLLFYINQWTAYCPRIERCYIKQHLLRYLLSPILETSTRPDRRSSLALLPSSAKKKASGTSGTAATTTTTTTATTTTHSARAPRAAPTTYRVRTSSRSPSVLCKRAPNKERKRAHTYARRHCEAYVVEKQAGSFAVDQRERSTTRHLTAGGQ